MTESGAARPPVDRATLVLDVARAGAATINAVLARGGVTTDVKSAGHDLVTTADRESEAAIIDLIRQAYPDDAVVGEESGAHPGTSGFRWLVDPLDGTANFVAGRSDHAVSVAVAVDGHPVAGAVVRAADGRWAHAATGRLTVGQGHAAGDAGYRPGTGPRRINDVARSADALVCLGLPYSMAGRQRALTLVREMIP